MGYCSVSDPLARLGLPCYASFMLDLLTVAVFTLVLAYIVYLWHRPRLIQKVMAETTRVCYAQFVAALQQTALESLVTSLTPAPIPPTSEPNESIN